ncbi:MAG: type IV pilin-like G/H family protein [Hormoscilla sp.]
MNDSNQNESSQGAGCVIIGLLGLGAIGCWFFVAPFVVPSLFNDAGKAKMSEAQKYVGSMNRAQQYYYFKNNEFTNDLNQLNLRGLDIPSETEFYFYVIRATSDTAFNYAIPRYETLRGYFGGVFVGVYPETGEETTFAIFCQTTGPGRFLPAEPQMETIGAGRFQPRTENGVPTCPAGTESF